MKVDPLTNEADLSMEESVQPSSRGELPRREEMQTPEKVAAMLRLKALEWSRTGCRRREGASE
jgi:hypothetical protein